jgi:hypothetical protein
MQFYTKQVDWILTLGDVGPSHGRAHPPQSDLERDACGDVTVWKADWFAGEQPDVAHEGRQQSDQGQYTPEDAQPGESCAASRVAHPNSN